MISWLSVQGIFPSINSHAVMCTVMGNILHKKTCLKLWLERTHWINTDAGVAQSAHFAQVFFELSELVLNGPFQLKCWL